MMKVRVFMSETAVITENSGEPMLSACNLHSFAISRSLAGPSLRWSMAQELYSYETHVRTCVAFVSPGPPPQKHIQHGCKKVQTVISCRQTRIRITTELCVSKVYLIIWSKNYVEYYSLKNVKFTTYLT